MTDFEDTKKTKKLNAKNQFFNFLGVTAVMSFLIIGIILILAASDVFGQISRAGKIASYIFGIIFLIIFTFIIIKIIIILKSENKYQKQAIDCDKLFNDLNSSEEQMKLHSDFNENFEKLKLPRNTFLGFLYSFEKKSFKRDDIDLKSLEVILLIEEMIIKTSADYGYFDVYLAIELMKSMNKKFVWKGDFKRYKTYFEYLRKIIRSADEYVRLTFVSTTTTK
ncbi:hypothetical protein HGG64_02200 [Mycoplasma phocoeninasale]|uniref:Uncharacterized protein n=1 Tax=Mycoplasma phocoeninasale TaxID=2726117 RepID=A0A858U0A6_9MOLU|nr:hypothetical protein [Mycoplasma phocoeninasale]QJG66504.1 hypothetical protein HGG64_02200 [Mycoplasma phocoeninasale]